MTVAQRNLLGTMPDREVAEKIGRTREWCARVRNVLGIPAEGGRGRYAAEKAVRDAIIETEVAGVVAADSLKPIIKERFQLGANTTLIAFELGARRCRVKRLLRGVDVARTWRGLYEVLAAGPKTSREIDKVWRKNPGRWLGWYRKKGWVIRTDGVYSLSETAPKPRETS